MSVCGKRVDRGRDRAACRSRRVARKAVLASALSALVLTGCNATRCISERDDVAGFLEGLKDTPVENSPAAFDRMRERLGYAENAADCPAGSRCASRTAYAMFGPGTDIRLISRPRRKGGYVLTLQSIYSACGMWPTIMNDEPLTARLGAPHRTVRRSRWLTELNKRYWVWRGGVVATEAPGWLRRWVSYQSPEMVVDPHAFAPVTVAPLMPNLGKAIARLREQGWRPEGWKAGNLLKGTSENRFVSPNGSASTVAVKLSKAPIYVSTPKVGWKRSEALLGVTFELTGAVRSSETTRLEAMLGGLEIGDATRIAKVFRDHIARPRFPRGAWRSIAHGNYLLLFRVEKGGHPVRRLGVWRRLEFWPQLRPPALKQAS